MSLTTIILAAGKSKRMNSLKTKLLFKILGKPLPDNSKSSSLAAMSIIDETKKFIDNSEINM